MLPRKSNHMLLTVWVVNAFDCHRVCRFKEVIDKPAFAFGRSAKQNRSRDPALRRSTAQTRRRAKNYTCRNNPLRALPDSADSHLACPPADGKTKKRKHAICSARISSYQSASHPGTISIAATPESAQMATPRLQQSQSAIIWKRLAVRGKRKSPGSHLPGEPPESRKK